MSTFSFFIGCDISKATIDVSYWNDNKAVYIGKFSNNEEGFLSIIKALRTKTTITIDEWFFCFENTGSYSKLLCKWLTDNAVSFIEENPLRVLKSLGLRRGKDDKVDSKDLSKYAFEKRDSIKPSEPYNELIIKLKKLLSRRDFLIKQKTGLNISLKEQKMYLDPELYEDLDRSNQVLIKEYSRQIVELEEKIEQTLKSDPSMWTTYKLAKSVIGIGQITAAYMIATTDNFRSFSDSRKYASYCGIAPFPNSSGTRKGTMKVSKMANMKIKSLLSNCILSSIRYDPQISRYYAKKIGEGKQPGVVMNAVKNKLVQRVFAVIKRQTPYVKLEAYV